MIMRRITRYTWRATTVHRSRRCTNRPAMVCYGSRLRILMFHGQNLISNHLWPSWNEPTILLVGSFSCIELHHICSSLYLRQHERDRNLSCISSMMRIRRDPCSIETLDDSYSTVSQRSKYSSHSQKSTIHHPIHFHLKHNEILI